MTLRLHNTLTRRVEEFAPRDAGKVAMYVCGPTVYDVTHVGHMRAAIVFDVLRRYLESQGYQVTHVQNITDVEDKIIAKAREEGVAASEVASRYSAEYHDAVRVLNVLPPHVEPRATEHILEMIEMIRRLVERGHAYYAEGDVYFDVTTIPGYGRLSGQQPDELRAGARVEPGEFKRHPADFTLWKRAKPGEPSWDSPWGKGRPGWHIECSAMSLKYLGMGFDIHGGGDDLVFPHHENEIAQSEGAAGSKPFARYWLHNAMVMVGEEKMSKSLHNYYTVTEALRRFSPEVIRYALVSVHYRKPIHFSEERFEETRKPVERIRSALTSIDAVRHLGDESTAEDTSQPKYAAAGGATAGIEDAAERARRAFKAAMDDDLNTSGALAAIFDLVTEINRAADAILKGTEPASAAAPTLVAAGDVLKDLLSVLGLVIVPLAERPSVAIGFTTSVTAVHVRGVVGRVLDLAAALRSEAPHLFVSDPPSELDEAVRFILRGREQARKARDFKTADAIRSRLMKAGVVVEDLPTGPRWRIAGTDGRGP